MGLSSLRACSDVREVMRAVGISTVLVGALVISPASAQDKAVKVGDCNVQIINSTVGDILLICDRYKAILTDLVQEIQKSAKRRGYSQMEHARFVEGVNAVLSGFAKSLSSLADSPKPSGPEFERKRIRVVLQLADVFDRLMGASAGDAAQFRVLAQNWRDRYQTLVAELGLR